jgi:hypothetical protein
MTNLSEGNSVQTHASAKLQGMLLNGFTSKTCYDACSIIPESRNDQALTGIIGGYGISGFGKWLK